MFIIIFDIIGIFDNNNRSHDKRPYKRICNYL